MCYRKFTQLFTILLLTSTISAVRVIQLQPFLVNNTIKFFFRPQVTVSKFPPVIELIVQRLQTYYSNYVYEDLSRPPTWDKPVYVLTPADHQQIASIPANPVPIQIPPTTENSVRATTRDPDLPNLNEYIELPDTSENFIEKERKKLVLN